MKDFKKLVITQVKNGYVVRIVNYGKSSFKEPYPEHRGVYVFQCEALMNDFLKKFWNGEEI